MLTRNVILHNLKVIFVVNSLLWMCLLFKDYTVNKGFFFFIWNSEPSIIMQDLGMCLNFFSLPCDISYSKVQRGWHFFSSIEVWHKMHLCLLKCWWFVYHSRRPLFLPPSLIPWLYLYLNFFFPKLGKYDKTHKSMDTFVQSVRWLFWPFWLLLP